MAQQATYDLILMDVHMPGLDGIEAAQRIRERLADSCPPIIALTADLFVTAPGDTKTTPFDDFLTKPVVAEALEAVIARWTGGDPGAGDISSAPGCETRTRGQRPPLETNKGPLLRPELEEQLHGEILRLCAELERSEKQSTGEEIADLAHQLVGIAGLNGLEELAANARELEQAARNDLPRSIAPALQKLAAITASLTRPSER